MAASAPILARSDSRYPHLVAALSPQDRAVPTWLAVDKANTLSGVNLLGNNDTLKTEDTIVQFLAAIQKERAKITRKNRNFTAPWFVALGEFGFGIP